MPISHMIFPLQIWWSFFPGYYIAADLSFEILDCDRNVVSELRSCLTIIILESPLS